MPRIEELRKEIKDEETLHGLASAFTEVSAGKIGVLKQKFEKNQRFYQEISDLYCLVKSSTNTPVAASKRVLSVAMTTNHRFYGVINLEVMKKFLSETKGQAAERLVIGKIGISYLQSIDFRDKVEKMVLSTDVPKMVDLEKLLTLSQSYQKVLLYHPQFQTIYTQTPAVTDIAYNRVVEERLLGSPARNARETNSNRVGPTPATTSQMLAGQKTAEESVHFIFEPELPKIIEFFETQIRTILLQRVLLEVELSVTASRLQAMSRAQEHAREVLSQRKRQLTKELHSQINARLLETVGRVKKWR